MRPATRWTIGPLAILMAMASTASFAAWRSEGSTTATAAATSVQQAAAPTVSRGVGAAAGSAVVTWPATMLASGAPVDGYRVERVVGQTVSTVCTSVAPTCADADPVAGPASYRVIATKAAHWAGPASSATSFTFDDQPPVSAAVVAPAPTAGTDWNRTDVTVTLSATDARSSVASITYAVDGGTPVTTSGSTVTFPLLGQAPSKTYAVTYRAVDAIGNVETTKSLTVKIDPTAPVSLAVLDPAPTSFGWNGSDVDVAVHGTDTGGSGVAKVTAQGTDTSGADATRRVTAEGTTTVPYFSTDVAGNAEGAKQAVVRIDRTAPTVSASPASSTAWTQTTQVTLTASDALSGIDRVEYKVDGAATWTTYTTPVTLPEGEHTVAYRAFDRAGNQASGSTSLRIRTSAPDVTISPASSDAWRVSAQVSVSATDPSGITSIEVSLDGGTTWQTYAAPFTPPQGTTVVRARATNGSGVVGTATPSTVRLDSVAPTSSASTTPLSITVTGADATSGVASVSYRLGSTGGYTTQNGTSTSFAVAAGTYTVWTYATDVAGNQSAPVSQQVVVKSEDVPPTVGINQQTGDYTNGSPSITALDAGSGVASIMWRTRTCATPASPCTGPWSATVTATAAGQSVFSTTATVPSGARMELEYWATDVAGNSSTPATKVYLYFTTSAPTISALTPANNAAATSFTAIDCDDALRLCATVTPGGAPVASVQYTLLRSSSNQCWNGSAYIGSAAGCPGVTATSLGSNRWGTGALSTTIVSDGTYVVAWIARDTAGNVSTGSSTFRIDSVAPTTPTIDPVITPDTGASSTDRITRTPQVTVTGTGEVGSTVQVGTLSGSSFTELCSATVPSGGSWSCALTLVAGLNGYIARAFDGLQYSAFSNSIGVDLDTTAPAAIWTGVGNGTNGPNGPTTTVAANTLVGSGESGASYAVTRTAPSAAAICSGTVGANNSISCPVTLPAGASTYSLSVTDAAGNVSTTTMTVTLQGAGPTIGASTPADGAAITSTWHSGGGCNQAAQTAALCVTVTPNAGTTVTYTLTKGGTQCFNGTAFVAGTSCAARSMTYSAGLGMFVGDQISRATMGSGSFSWTITATSSSGTSTSTRTFSIS